MKTYQERIAFDNCWCPKISSRSEQQFRKRIPRRLLFLEIDMYDLGALQHIELVNFLCQRNRLVEADLLLLGIYLL